ncbi:hypothetical protein ACFL6F_01515 [Planctomycetota bacterium]
MKKICIILLAVCCVCVYAEEPSRVFKYFNGKSLGFVCIDKVSQFRDDYNNTGMGKIWAEKEMQAFLGEPLKKVMGLLKQGSEMTGFDFEKIWEVCKNVEGGIGLSLIDVDIDKGFPKLVFVMTGIKKDDQAFVAENINKLEQLILQNPTIKATEENINGRSVKILQNTQGQNNPDICYHITKDEIIIGLTKEAMSQALSNFEKNEVEPNIALSLKFCGLPEQGGIFGFADGLNIVALIKKVMVAERARPDEVKIFNELHFEDIISLSLHSSIKGPGFYNRFFVDLADEKKGIGKLITGAPLKAELIKEIPKTVTSFSAVNVDLLKIWDVAMDLMKKIMPENEFQQVQGIIAGVEVPLGVKIRDELLASLSGEILYYQFMPAMAMQMPGIVLKLKLKDNASITKLVNGFLIPMAAQRGLGIKDVIVGDYTVKMIPIQGIPVPGLMPGFIITDKELIVSTTQAGMQTALVPPVSSVLDNTEYQFLNEYVDSKEASSVSFTDVKKTFKTLYSLMPLLMNMPNVGQVTGLEIAKLPLTQTIVQHLIGMKSIGKTVNGDMFAEIYGPVDYLTTGVAIGAAAGAFAGVRAQDEVAVARTVDAKTGKQARIKEIYNACTIYALDHNGKLPAKISDLYPDYVMDVKIFGEKGLTKETIGTKGSFILVNGVKLTDKGEKIILHERITAGMQKGIVIRVDGTVAEMSGTDLKAALEKQSAQ